MNRDQELLYMLYGIVTTKLECEMDGYMYAPTWLTMDTEEGEALVATGFSLPDNYTEDDVVMLMTNSREQYGYLYPYTISELPDGKSQVRLGEIIDRESAYEILTRKIKAAEELAYEMKEAETRHRSTSRRRGREKSTLEKVMGSTTTRQIGRTVAREITRGLLGVLGISTTRRRKKSSWF